MSLLPFSYVTFMSLLPFSCVMFYVIATLQLCNFNFITSDGCSVGLMLEGVSEDTIKRLDMVEWVLA